MPARRRVTKLTESAETSIASSPQNHAHAQAPHRLIGPECVYILCCVQTCCVPMQLRPSRQNCPEIRHLLPLAVVELQQTELMSGTSYSCLGGGAADLRHRPDHFHRDLVGRHPTIGSQRWQSRSLRVAAPRMRISQLRISQLRSSQLRSRQGIACACTTGGNVSYEYIYIYIYIT